MIKTIEKAKRVQQKRWSLGKRGLAMAVRRFLKREKLGVVSLSN